MLRIRTVKPDVAKHELLFEAEQETGFPLRFAWVLFPSACDREGRFKWRPRAMKADILPYDDVDFSEVLNALLVRGFIVKYRCGDDWFGLIPTMKKHQHINNREPESQLPPIESADEVIDGKSTTSTREPRVKDAPLLKGMEGNGKEGSAEPLRVTPPTPAFLEFPVIGDKTWPLQEPQVVDWERLFPGIDVRGQCRKALAWVLAKPNRKKTSGGMAAFLVRWLSTDNDSGRRGPSEAPVAKPDDSAKRLYGQYDLKGNKP